MRSPQRWNHFRELCCDSNFSSFASSILEVIFLDSCTSRVVFAKLIVEPTEKANPIPIKPFVQLSTGKYIIPIPVAETDRIKEAQVWKIQAEL